MQTLFMPGSFNLYQLTNAIIKSSLHQASRRNSYFINKIPAGLEIEADAELVSGVVSGLLAFIINSASGSSIAVTAKNYSSGIMLMHIRNCNIADNAALEEELNCLQKRAEKIGGIVGLGGQRQGLTTLTFSFPCLQLAA